MYNLNPLTTNSFYSFVETFKHGAKLTIILQAFLIPEDIGLHVPYELMGQQLRVLGCPQDELCHIAHLQQSMSPSTTFNEPIYNSQ